MKFMVTWRVHPDKREPVLKAFAQMTPEDDQRDLGNQIKLIGRWHDIADSSGVAICESEDPIAMSAWALNWNSVLDLEVRMVLDDAEVRALGQQRIAQQTEIKTSVVHN